MNPMRLFFRGFVRLPALVTLVAAGASSATADAPPAGAPAAVANFTLDAYTALGSAMAKESHLPELGWDQPRIAAFLSGVKSAFEGRGQPPTPELAELKHELDETIQALEVQQRHATLTTPAGLKQFLKKTRKEASLRETDTGLCYRVLKPGTGVHPRLQDAVVVSFECHLADDMALVPSVQADHLRVKVADLLPGLSEGLQMLTTDGELLLVVPPDLSFRDGPWPTGVDPGMPLAFVIKLHEVIPATAAR